MPTPDATRPTPAGRAAPTYLSAHLTGLRSASVAVTRDGDRQVSARVGGATAAVVLVDEPGAVRQVATDIIAQLDAIEAAGR